MEYGESAKAAATQPVVLFLISALLACALPAHAAAKSRPRSVLANGPGLEQRITYSETRSALGDLVGAGTSPSRAGLSSASGSGGAEQ
jgi:hypothetical protein